MRRRLAGVVLGALLSVSCAEEVPLPEPVERPVRVERVRRAAPAVTVVAGVAQASIDSKLSFRTAGTVIEVLAEVGDRVDRGGVLARLDPTDHELSVNEAQAALAQARAARRQASADYERVRGLYEASNASKSELDAARANFESSEASYDATDQRLAQARQQVSYTELRAPVSGAIAELLVQVNETVGSGQAVVRLTSGTTPEVEVGVSERLIASLREGQPATVRFDALPGRSFRGELSEVGVAIADGSSTYPVTVRLLDEASDVRSGMAADVEVSSRGPRAVNLTVQLVSVLEDEGGRFVYVLDQAEKAVRRRNVEVGVFSGTGVEIVAGLEEGELVVTAGVRILTDGMRVAARVDSSVEESQR